MYVNAYTCVCMHMHGSLGNRNFSAPVVFHTAVDDNSNYAYQHHTNSHWNLLWEIKKTFKKQIISVISSHLNCMEKKIKFKKKKVNFTPHDENGY